MKINFRGTHRRYVTSRLVHVDLSPAENFPSMNEVYCSPAIVADEDGLTVIATTESNPNIYLKGTYDVVVHLTGSDVARLALALWGNRSFGEAIASIWRNTYSGKRMHYLETSWLPRAKAALKEKNTGQIEKLLQSAVSNIEDATSPAN